MFSSHPQNENSKYSFNEEYQNSKFSLGFISQVKQNFESFPMSTQLFQEGKTKLLYQQDGSDKFLSLLY